MQCKRLPSIGRDVCAMHGGKSRKGFESPTFKTGAHSKFLSHLPETMKTDFCDIFDVDEAQSLREQIAISNIRTQQLLALLSGGDLGNLWSQMKEHFRALKNNLELGLDVSADISGIESLVEAGESNFVTWQQINEQSDRTRKLAGTQIKLELGNLDRQIRAN